MENLFAALFEILSFGSIVVLVVLGLGIIASMMGIFNFAQGEFVLLGAYITYLAHTAGLPVWTGMVAAPFLVGAFGLVLERLIVRRFYAAPIVAMLGTYALGLIIREIVRGLIGGLYISVPEPIGGSITVGDVHLSTWRLVIIVVTALVMIGSYLLLSRTSFGLRVRASLENPALARASGISTNAIYGATFAFGAALAGLAGALIVPVFSLFADLGLRFLIQGFIAVMVGGVGSFAGPVAGAGIIGTLSAALPWVIQPVIADVLVFVLAIIFIKFRPQGLVSGKGI
ncbi:MAG: branched-chain amino acid ABC transporter permease [Rhodopseudomonas sp.]|jgi:branched-chain amino acid transport system permease protein|uniref:Amino acid/amide ABC transporter membrane protein 1 (HAAT family) n=3 Tax=Rhodopseudomonas TaxID=1073 RepID=A0A336JQ11_9BRAD|nr:MULTISPECIES: branched-chain amino acid ABC transporter permease [Rhodopseudomonas]MCD0417032.1 branched-chain amino acid ABC transporter permease [Rubrivivax sp. JA1024]NEW92864.1 branched-chain amino acid ABC transporter permease [Rhodopseudomonas sp. BR0M22]RED32006.1 amino acid/amide ABC transporter membrane protein 1 (HAAT family) [Rhodopseudomonas pentothenatexigens]REF93387.1 amino acid/amide ABC transporter membrane protein 1 (HAAT family) [Rhodopseudomonas thermotolerans]UYO40711.1